MGWRQAKRDLAVAQLFKESGRIVPQIAEDMAPMFISSPGEWAPLFRGDQHAVLQFQIACEEEYRRRGGTVRANRAEIGDAVYRFAVKSAQLILASEKTNAS